jgi:hypothetical protein
MCLILKSKIANQETQNMPIVSGYSDCRRSPLVLNERWRAAGADLAQWGLAGLKKNL